ncbi:hypothetical protein NECAME_09848 [Necator americanus]|uniref:Uncharacterized protein n=1 Tax=Necator americanus TaxID=51031 RepID=W2TBJ9_NECAM|nr:hypothetical protein NECAME_09848 [Necator americanus]ETN79410.1 hypothetical protein NECAME_09848 [Necator americanus]
MSSSSVLSPHSCECYGLRVLEELEVLKYSEEYGYGTVVHTNICPNKPHQPSSERNNYERGMHNVCIYLVYVGHQTESSPRSSALFMRSECLQVKL